jgi:hypothetical protein
MFAIIQSETGVDRLFSIPIIELTRELKPVGVESLSEINSTDDRRICSIIIPESHFVSQGRVNPKIVEDCL